MSSGRSFHSVAGRAFWKESVEEDAEGGLVLAGGRRGGPKVAEDGGCGDVRDGGCVEVAVEGCVERLMASVRTVGLGTGGGDAAVLAGVGFVAGESALGPMCLRMTQAVLGRSLK